MERRRLRVASSGCFGTILRQGSCVMPTRAMKMRLHVPVPTDSICPAWRCSAPETLYRRWREPGGLAPHPSHPGTHVDARAVARGPRLCIGCGWRPVRPLEQPEKMLGNKTGSRCIDVAVTLRVLTVRKKALGYDKMQIILGAGHGDVKQPTFFFDLGRCPDAEVRGHTAIDHIEHKDRLPLLAFCGMDRRQDQIVLVKQGNAGLITSSVRRIESEFGEETFP